MQELTLPHELHHTFFFSQPLQNSSFLPVAQKNSSGTDHFSKKRIRWLDMLWVWRIQYPGFNTLMVLGWMRKSLSSLASLPHKKVKQKQLHSHYPAKWKQKKFLPCSCAGKWDPVKRIKASPSHCHPHWKPPPWAIYPQSLFHLVTEQDDGSCKTIKDHKNKVILQKAREVCLIFNVWWGWYFTLFTQTSSS